MKTLSMLKVGVAPAALGLAMLATQAVAQEVSPQTATADAAPAEGVIVVTGSRIASPNLTSVAPITAISNEDFKLQGTTKTEDLLNSLPQVFASQSSTLSNGATGTATVNLRGLGSQRTLVLINGRRLMPGDPTSSAADLNFIPSSLVKRVEVLTGGASATYGADAVAGVVNFIMDTDFTGFRIDANYGLYQHNNGNKITPALLDKRANAGFSGFNYPKGNVADGGTFDTTVSFGTDLGEGRGHMTAYFGYRKVNPILQRNRDYSACTIQNTGAKIGSRLNPDAPLQCGGSATSATGTVFYHTASTSSSTLGALGPGTLTQGTLNRYNFAPLNYFQRPDERYTAGVFANYEINDSIKPYMEFMFMDDRTLAQIAPSGDFGNTMVVNCDNPLMSADQRGQLCTPNNTVMGYLGTFPVVPGLFNALSPAAQAIVTPPPYNNLAYFQLLRRNVEGGPRISDLQHTSFRTVIGSKGSLGEAWTYDAYYQFGRTNYSQVYSNEFSVSRLKNALDVVTGPNGQPTCRSVILGTDPNCVPYDVFGGTPSPASISYLNASGFQKGIVTQQVLSGYLAGDLSKYGIKTPWAQDGVNVVFGAEYRRDSLDLKTDNAFSTGDLAGQGAATLPVAGSYKVTEFFTEADLPLVQEGVFYNLSLQGGYRYSHYAIKGGNTFNTDTYKLGVDFAPVRDIRFRAAYNRAVRAPNIQELFAPQVVALDGVTDPCSGFTITAADTGCLAQGLRVGQNVTANPAAQYNGFIGGNPSLKPEVATTKTVGVVLQPRWIPNFSLSVDYFDIKVNKAIQGYGADAILSSCVNDNNAFACGLVQRNPAGSLWLSSDGYVRDLPTNVGGVQTRGLEFNGSYSHSIGNVGTLSLTMVGTYLDRYSVDNGLTAVYDCAGYFGPTCGTSAPKWRHRARLGFAAKNGMGLSLTWRYFSGVDVEYKNPSSTLNNDYYNYSSRIGAQSYFDLAFSTRIKNQYTWRIGVNNMFDKEPPLVTSGSGTFGASACGSLCNGNTYPGTYDSLGRYIYSSITLDF